MRRRNAINRIPMQRRRRRQHHRVTMVVGLLSHRLKRERGLPALRVRFKTRRAVCSLSREAGEGWGGGWLLRHTPVDGAA